MWCVVAVFHEAGRQVAEYIAWFNGTLTEQDIAFPFGNTSYNELRVQVMGRSTMLTNMARNRVARRDTQCNRCSALVAPHEVVNEHADFPAPDVLVQVVDATALEKDLELSLELSLFGRPLVIALNRVDEARKLSLIHILFRNPKYRGTNSLFAAFP